MVAIKFGVSVAEMLGVNQEWYLPDLTAHQPLRAGTKLMVPEKRDAVRWAPEGHAWVGSRVRRRFSQVVVDGVIVAYMPTSTSGKKVEYWHVVHDDGDEEVSRDLA